MIKHSTKGKYLNRVKYSRESQQWINWRIYYDDITLLTHKCQSHPKIFRVWFKHIRRKRYHTIWWAVDKSAYRFNGRINFIKALIKNISKGSTLTSKTNFHLKSNIWWEKIHFERIAWGPKQQQKSRERIFSLKLTHSVQSFRNSFEDIEPLLILK